MVKISTALVLVFAIVGFTSCDTLVRRTLITSVDRSPTLTIVNQTGLSVVVTAPVSETVANGARTLLQPTETNQVINVTYMIGHVQFTEQVTMANADATITLTRRPPTITVVNRTGGQVTINAPVFTDVGNGESHQFLTPALNQVIPVTYRVGLMYFTEQVTMGDQDVTVTLTRAPPTLTLVNNTGLTLNTIFLRVPGNPIWSGGNIMVRGGVVVGLGEAHGAGEGISAASIINGDSMQIWMGNVPLSGDRFDVRTEPVGGSPTFVRSNVHVTGDLTLAFTQADVP